MDPLKGVLQKIIGSNAALKLGVQEARIIELWPEAVGIMISKHARAVYMKNKTVFVEVDSPIWKQELFTNKQVALKKYNQIVDKSLGASNQGLWVEDLFFLSPGANPNSSREKSERR